MLAKVPDEGETWGKEGKYQRPNRANYCEEVHQDRQPLALAPKELQLSNLSTVS